MLTGDDRGEPASLVWKQTQAASRLLFQRGLDRTETTHLVGCYLYHPTIVACDLAAIDDALASSVHARSAMAFDKSAFGIAAVGGAVSARIADYRASRTSDVSFTEEDRAQQDSEKQRK